VADLLRGDCKQSEYGNAILPLTVLRRLGCVFEPTKAKVLEAQAKYAARSEDLDPILIGASGQQFFNTSKLALPLLCLGGRLPPGPGACSRSSSPPRSAASTGPTSSTRSSPSL
jgi:hypothetical protein